MTAPTRRPSAPRRALAAIAMTLALAAGVPSTAAADDFWGLWVSEVQQRVWWEMPFAIAVSFPAMVITTPFWLGLKGPDLIRGDGDDGGDDE